MDPKNKKIAELVYELAELVDIDNEELFSKVNKMADLNHKQAIEASNHLDYLNARN